MNRMFEADLNELRPFIVEAERESYEIGCRISRTAQYKKSREPAWGMMRNERDEIVNNPHEQKINHLIRLLGTTASSVAEIATLIYHLGVTDGKDPFTLVEYDEYNTVDLNVHHMPYGMYCGNIADTLKYYEIRHRKRLNWTNHEIVDIIRNNNENKENRENSAFVDSLIDDFEMLGESECKEEERVKNIHDIRTNWIYIWYDPAIGLPPNVLLPFGMNLPNHPCELYIPKL